MDGFLNLNKPVGLTSHDCVAKVRRLLQLKRVGHAGTLDPAATGVLPIAFGRATRLLQFLPGDKAYHATIRFGLTTTTDDLEGEVLTSQPGSELKLDAVKAVLPQFQGTLQQFPPRYSAVQVGGRRLYEMARAGQTIAVQPRTVQVHHITVLDWRSGEFPELDVEIACGSGTYIRSIARDLGQILQTGGTLAALLRTESSGFHLQDSLSLTELEEKLRHQAFIPVEPESVLHLLDALVLPHPIAKRWCQGQRIALADLNTLNPAIDIPLRIHHESGKFLGVGQYELVDEAPRLKAIMVYETDPT